MRREVHTVINTEAGVWPAPHLVNRLPVDFAFPDEQLKDFVLPNVQQKLLVDPGKAQERAVRSEDAVGGNGMDVGMVVDQLAEGLDAGNHAGGCIATIEHLSIHLDGGLPSGAG
jgi:hypothetical protein